MLIIDSLEKMKPYYNENTKTYEFLDNGKLINVFFTFSIDIKTNIYIILTEFSIRYANNLRLIVS